MFCENSFLSVSRLVAAIASRDRFTRSFCFATIADSAASSRAKDAVAALPSFPTAAAGSAGAAFAGEAAFVLWLSYCWKVEWVILEDQLIAGCLIWLG